MPRTNFKRILENPHPPLPFSINQSDISLTHIDVLLLSMNIGSQLGLVDLLRWRCMQKAITRARTNSVWPPPQSTAQSAVSPNPPYPPFPPAPLPINPAHLHFQLPVFSFDLLNPLSKFIKKQNKTRLHLEVCERKLYYHMVILQHWIGWLNKCMHSGSCQMKRWCYLKSVS